MYYRFRPIQVSQKRKEVKGKGAGPANTKPISRAYVPLFDDFCATVLDTQKLIAI